LLLILQRNCSSIEAKEEEKQLGVANSKVKSARARVGYSSLGEIPKLDPGHEISSSDEVIIFVSQIRDKYNDKFEKLLMSSLAELMKDREASAPLQVYQVDVSDPEVSKALAVKYNATVAESTIFLMKSRYCQALMSVKFEEFVEYPNFPALYLSELSIARTTDQIHKHLERLDPASTCLVYSTDLGNPSALSKAKHLQKVLFLSSMRAIQLLVIDQQRARESGVVS
jgi:hypothetical protein